MLVFLALLLKHFDGKYGTRARPPLPAAPADVEAHPPRGAPAWVKIRYDDLIDREIITHSGKTVGRRLQEIARSGRGRADRGIAELQPYLEPFSSVCNDVVSAAGPPDSTPYRTVAADYPAGSRQPAWAAMVREGIFQLFVAGGKARLFLKGEDPGRLLERMMSVVRHPLGKAMETAGVDRLTLEVYAFRNDYASRTIHLDIHPHIVDISRVSLVPGKRDLALTRLEEFFNQGVTLEAAGFDGEGHFSLYGSPSTHPTLAGSPQSLEDFAVVYRSVFHNGGNAPYISLDRHEDNRYAKVNFGGFLEDTRIGSVVLEADKLFKTLCTGLDPNTRQPVREGVLAAIPDFRTGAERGLRDKVAGYSEIRYWFYPDRIQTVTDGSLGVVRNWQFTADAERMDRKVALGRDQRETIDHLNRNYDRYAAVFPAYRELDTVGRMMAIANWLLRSGAGDRVDLDALLSVELSAFRTPRRTRKLLAVTAEATPGEAVKDPGAAQRTVYCLDDLLDGWKPSASDREMLDAATRHFSGMRAPGFPPSRAAKEHASVEAGSARIRELEARLKALGTAIVREHGSNGRGGDNEARRIRSMAEEYRSLEAAYDNAVAAYNRSLEGLRRIGYGTDFLVSIGGGIDLRPRDFARPLNVPDSPLIRRIRHSKEVIRSSPSGAGEPLGAASPRPGAATAERPPSDAGKGGVEATKTEKTVREKPPREKSVKERGNVERDRTPSGGREAGSGGGPAAPVRKEVVVRTPAYPGEIVAIGEFSAGGTIVLRRGKSPSAPEPGK